MKKRIIINILERLQMERKIIMHSKQNNKIKIKIKNSNHNKIKKKNKIRII